jgi:DNA-binding response OmpR family regulator/two-component sensor histidine kinase
MQEQGERRARVLVVDDERGVRESLRVILHGEFDVVTAASGEEALAVVAREPIDIMTLDLKMPGLGGVPVLQRVRQADPDIEVLIITGNGSLDTAVEGLRLRALDYLTKPFDCDRVRRLVQAAAARRAGMRRMRTMPAQFVDSLAADLRSPLDALLGGDHDLRDLPDDERQVLDRVQSNSGALLAYIETLFYMAQLDRGAVPSTVAPVDVATLLRALRDELAPQAAAKGIGWHVDVPAMLGLTTDGDMLLRLVRALADNAVRFTVAGEVRIAARPARGGITVQIDDTGPGLPAHLITEAEDVVARRTPATQPRRLGFGLRLASRLARTLGAVMTIAASGSGTSVKLIVPDTATATAASTPAR